MTKSSSPRIVDLFCGVGGFGLGAQRAGFDLALSVDVDPVLTSAHHLNFPSSKLSHRDLSAVSGEQLLADAGGSFEGLIGGPPCQGFSSIGKADPLDPRRELLFHFFRLVLETRPRFFVMENVKGLVAKKNLPLLHEAISSVSDVYRIVGPIILDASDFGAATRRPRVFVFGYQESHFRPFIEQDIAHLKRPATTVVDAIGDLQTAVMSEDVDGFDNWEYGDAAPSPYAQMLRESGETFTGHKKIVHKNSVAERFASVPEGSRDPIGKHHKLSWTGQCPTLRAGTGPDKGSFQAVRPLHPTEPRVITIREAARLQGFPDWFKFHPTSWHSFRMIGNSVSPVIAEQLLGLIKAHLVPDGWA